MDLLRALAWWSTSGNTLSLVMLIFLLTAALGSWRAVGEAVGDVRHVEARFHHRRSGDRVEHPHGRASAGATLILARARVRSERTRFLALLLLASLEALTLFLPGVGSAMSHETVLILALRKLGRLALAALLVWWLWADYRDRHQVLASIQHE